MPKNRGRYAGGDTGVGGDAGSSRGDAGSSQGMLGAREVIKNQLLCSFIKNMEDFLYLEENYFSHLQREYTSILSVKIKLKYFKNIALLP